MEEIKHQWIWTCSNGNNSKLNTEEEEKFKWREHNWVSGQLHVA